MKTGLEAPARDGVTNPGLLLPGSLFFALDMSLFRSVSFRLFGLSIAIIIVLSITVLLLRDVVQREASLSLLENDQALRMAQIHHVQHSLSALRLLQGKVGTALMARDETWRVQAEQTLAEAQAQFESELNAIAPFAAEAVARTRLLLAGVPAELQKTVSAIHAGRQAEAEQYTRELHSRVQEMEQSLIDAEVREGAVFAALREQEHQAAQDSLRWAWYSTIATVIFGLLLALTVSRSLVQPLRRVVAAVQRVTAGEPVTVLPRVRPDEFGDIAQALHQFQGQAEKLRTMAYRDSLTGLANRARLDESLSAGIVKCARNGSSLALLFLDLDDFKSVNDSQGHSAGDRFLREAARRLQRLAPDNALVCRYSGDKFTVMLGGLKRNGEQQAQLRSLAETLLRGMAEPYQTNGDFLYMTVSIGIAAYPADGQSAEQIVSSADAAMYLAKRSGRNNMQFASADLTDDARRKVQMAGEIHRGIQAGEFEPYYQPIINVRTGAVVGAEALLRWHHPQRGIVLPSEFIRVAEDSGLIGELGERCLTRAYDQALRWCGQSREIPVAVNLSARQLQDNKVLKVVQQLQGVQQLQPHYLEFEITESAMMERPEQSHHALQEIRQRGHKLGLDDFGTGYSALGYLQRFPIDRIKIDRSFVAKVESSRQSRAIISATLAMADSLNLEVVAEGVETAAQQQHMRDLGCALQQGFHFTPALPPAEFEDWLSSRD